VKEAVTPAQLFGRQLAELRAAIGLTQRELVQRLEERLGVKMDPATLARIEKADGKRVTLDEAFVLAAGLGVSPLHLMAPRAGNGTLRIGENSHYHFHEIREWLRGRAPLSDSSEDDRDAWRLGQPPDKALQQSLAASQAAVTVAASTLKSVRDALAAALTAERAAEEAADGEWSEETDLRIARQRRTLYEAEVVAARAAWEAAVADLDRRRTHLQSLGYHLPDAPDARAEEV
jgi:transcriptional regulator with XRE-family HTH domain